VVSKENLRHQLLTQRRALSKHDVITKSKTLSSKLIEFDKQHSYQNYIGYMATQNECDLTDFYKWILENNKTLFFPKYEKNGYIIVKIDTLTDLTKGHYNILEPKKNNPQLTKVLSETACWLIPGIGFDQQGHRLGFGKGIYDRLLSQYSGYKLAVCYDFQIQPIIPSEKHDITYDQLIIVE